MVSKWMSIDVEFDQAIELATVNAAKVFGLGVKIGTLRPGSEADIGISELQEGSFDFFDGGKAKRVGRRRLVSTATVCRGELFVNRL